MRYDGEKAMKRVVLAAVAALFLTIACANSEQSVILEKFIPLSEQNSCKLDVASILWYDIGYMDIYFTQQYLLPFKMVNYMNVSSQTGDMNPEQSYDIHEANRWKLERLILEYELPPVPGVDGGAWATRTVESGVLIDPEGGKIAGAVDLFTTAQHTNLRNIFTTLFNAGVIFDWETYPIIVDVQGEGIKLGGGDRIRTNKLRFSLVPLYGLSVMMGSVYPVNDDWPTDEELQEQYPVEAAYEQAKYERDKEIYDVIMEYCYFPTSHLEGCFPGQDGALLDCYTFGGADDLIRSLFPGYECCPIEQPDEPEEPETATP